MAAVLVEREGGVGIVVLGGEQDEYGAPRVARELDALLDDGLSVVVDLSPAVFVDSTTLLELLRARKAAAAAGLGFVLQIGEGTGEYVRRTFELTRLTSVFSIATSRDTAVERTLAGVTAAELGAEPA